MAGYLLVVEGMTLVNEFALGLICLSQALATEAFLSRDAKQDGSGVPVTNAPGAFAYSGNAGRRT